MALSSTISRLITIPLLLVASDSTGRAGSPEPTIERSLERSLLGRDHSALAEIGARSSAADLATFLDPGHERASTLAAISAATQCEDAWALLVPLARVAGGPDRPFASAAAMSALEIAGSLTATTVAEKDIPDDLLADAVDAWRSIAIGPHRWADVRVHGLATVAALGPLDPGSAMPLVEQLAGDPDPEVRRAAFELMPLPLPDTALAIAGRTLAEDSDPVVAVAAAQAACGGLAARSTDRANAPERASAPVLAALGEPGLTRLRELVAETVESSPAATLDAARCLAAAGDPGSLQALRALQSRGPRYLRQRIRGLLSQRRNPER